jgi:oligopeptide/dipeptide ABC transporter ATP-binding protein
MPEAADEYILRVEDLSAAYTSKRGLVHAVNNISFGIRRGESVGLFGESGAGKSSVALAILGIFEKTAKFGSASGDRENKRLWELREKARKQGKTSDDIGEKLPGVEGHIWYKGEDLLALDEEEFRKIRGNDITYVPQGTMQSLNPYTNIQLQTAESLWAHDDESVLYEREVLRRVLEVLDLVEIGDIDIRKVLKPKEFSMGEDQRVLIAMALIMQPEILIADEPTTALDVGVQGRIMDAINLVREKLDLTMLLITNDQGLMAETADRIAVMSAGRIMEFADAATILKHPGHPFTRAFLMSNPSMDMIRRIREKGLILRGIPGNPPDMTNPPSGCPFHPRCQYKKDICIEQVPEYREVEDDHWIFCHRYEELPEF